MPMPMPMPMSQPEPQPEPQQEAQEQPQSPPAPVKDVRLSQIDAVRTSVEEYRKKVDDFKGSKKDREFLYLDEMLTRALLQLDNVDPNGCDVVRQARRAVIKEINASISLLETKASEPQIEAADKTQEAAASDTIATNTQAETTAAPEQQQQPEQQSTEGTDQQQPAQPATSTAQTEATETFQKNENINTAENAEKMESAPQEVTTTTSADSQTETGTVTTST